MKTVQKVDQQMTLLESSAGLLDLCGGLVTIVLKGRMRLGLESPYPGRGIFRQLQCPVSSLKEEGSTRK